MYPGYPLVSTFNSTAVSWGTLICCPHCRWEEISRPRLELGTA